MKRRTLERFTGLLVFIGVVLFLPFILPAVLVFDQLDRLRLRRAAKTFPCVGCGNILGTESIRLADEEFARHMAEMKKKYPNVKFKTHRPFDAKCVHCGKPYRFHKMDGSFVEVRIIETVEPGVPSAFNG
jgi:hypothetical protein